MRKTVIDANSRSFLPDLRELLRYKDLFFTLAWRDFRIKYAQTTVGVLWAVIQPVITLTILTLIFHRVAGIETEVNHTVFTIAGMSIWTYFSYVLTNSGNSVIQSQGMIKKIYFPRLIVPLSKALVGLIDMGIALLLLVILMIYHGESTSLNVLFAPLFILMGMLAALAAGIWLSALTVRYRDFQHIIPFVVQIGLYISPVAFPSKTVAEMLPNWLVPGYYLNPMAGIIEGFRWSIFGGEPPGNMMYVSFGMVILLLVSGLFYFKRIEGEIADYV